MPTSTGQGGPTDFELVVRARSGDHAAFHELVDRHAERLFAAAMAMSGNAADAEDLVQETFAGAYRGMGRFRGEASVGTWLARILMRQCARRLRGAGRPGRRTVSIDRLTEGAAAAGPSDSHADARIDVASAMASLTAEHRQVIALREFQGLSYDEIAQALGVPRGTVESRLFRARRQLQERLRGYLP